MYKVVYCRIIYENGEKKTKNPGYAVIEEQCSPLKEYYEVILRALYKNSREAVIHVSNTGFESTGPR